MPRIRSYDVPGGDTVLYDMVDEPNGYRLCTFDLPEEGRDEGFANIRHLRCRDDDIFLNSYPKTGGNWLWEMISLMVKKKSEVGKENKGMGMIEARPSSLIDEMPSPRILNSHLKVQYIPKETLQRKLKTIMMVRNPKDVVVSFYHHTKGFTTYDYDGKFENFLQMFLRGEVDCGSYPEYLQEWQQYIKKTPDIPFHIVYYEDMIKDCFSELKRLRDFLDLDVNDALLKAIADSCAINKMRDAKQKLARDEKGLALQKIFKQGFNILRKGQIGDWKNHLTVAQNEMFDAWWEKETKGLDMFKFRYTCI